MSIPVIVFQYGGPPGQFDLTVSRRDVQAKVMSRLIPIRMLVYHQRETTLSRIRPTKLGIVRTLTGRKTAFLPAGMTGM